MPGPAIVRALILGCGNVLTRTLHFTGDDATARLTDAVRALAA